MHPKQQRNGNLSTYTPFQLSAMLGLVDVVDASLLDHGWDGLLRQIGESKVE